MTIVLSIVAGLVVAVAIAWGIGVRLPRDHVAARKIRIAAPAADIFAVLDDRAQAPRWRTGVTKVDVLDDTRFVEHGKHGAMKMRVVEREAARRIVVAVDDPDAGYGGTWTFALAAEGEHSVLTVTERGWVGPPLMPGFNDAVR